MAHRPRGDCSLHFIRLQSEQVCDPRHGQRPSCVLCAATVRRREKKVPRYGFAVRKLHAVRGRAECGKKQNINVSRTGGWLGSAGRSRLLNGCEKKASSEPAMASCVVRARACEMPQVSEPPQRASTVQSRLSYALNRLHVASRQMIPHRTGLFYAGTLPHITHRPVGTRTETELRRLASALQNLRLVVAQDPRLSYASTIFGVTCKRYRRA
jgi:hypothetical protein